MLKTRLKLMFRMSSRKCFLWDSSLMLQGELQESSFLVLPDQEEIHRPHSSRSSLDLCTFLPGSFCSKKLTATQELEKSFLNAMTTESLSQTQSWIGWSSRDWSRVIAKSTAGLWKDSHTQNLKWTYWRQWTSSQALSSCLRELRTSPSDDLETEEWILTLEMCSTLRWTPQVTKALLPDWSSYLRTLEKWLRSGSINSSFRTSCLKSLSEKCAKTWTQRRPLRRWLTRLSMQSRTLSEISL